MTNDKYDVVVVGAGIMGIAHAYHCARAGLRVALAERHEAPRGATVQNFGQIVPSGMSSKWQRLGRRSLQTYRQIQQTFDISARQQGSIYLASDDQELTLLEEMAAINRQNDYPSELWTARQCRFRYSSLRADYCRGGLFFPGEINLDPRVAGRRIIEYTVQTYGLTYLPRTTIREVSGTHGGVRLTTSQGRMLHAGKVFICSGSEFQLLFPHYFAQSDLLLVQLQMLQTVPQPTVKIPGSVLTGWSIRRYESFRECPSYEGIKATEDRDSYQMRQGVHILFKQAADGSVIIGDSHRYAKVGESAGLEEVTDMQLNRFIVQEAQKIHALEDWTIDRSWLGYYCQSENQDILNEEVQDHVHIVTGIGGKGMTASLGYAEENVRNTLSIRMT